jgi:Trypsin-like peptidase domain
MSNRTDQPLPLPLPLPPSQQPAGAAEAARAGAGAGADAEADAEAAGADTARQQPEPAAVEALKALSTLVIIFEGRWRNVKEFMPSPDSPRPVNWDEGTATIIGRDRTSAYILLSIHKKNAAKCSFWVKGRATGYQQTPAQLMINRFEENDGIDVAMLSCNVEAFDDALLSRYLPELRWRYTSDFRRGAAVWLVHFPTVDETELSGENATCRLRDEVEPEVAYGVVLSQDVATFLFNSTIVATPGSSGGVVIDVDGHVIGVHDSIYHKDHINPTMSSHRAAAELKQYFLDNLSHVVKKKGLF